MAGASSHMNQEKMCGLVHAGEAAPGSSFFFSLSPYQPQLSQCFKRGGVLTWPAAVKLATLLIPQTVRSLRVNWGWIRSLVRGPPRFIPVFLSCFSDWLTTAVRGDSVQLRLIRHLSSPRQKPTKVMLRRRTRWKQRELPVDRWA